MLPFKLVPTCEENDALGPHVVLVAVVVHAVAADEIVPPAPHVEGLALLPQVILQSHHRLVNLHRVVLQSTSNKQSSKVSNGTHDQRQKQRRENMTMIMMTLISQSVSQAGCCTTGSKSSCIAYLGGGDLRRLLPQRLQDVPQLLLQ